MSVPILVLSPRYSSDSRILRSAALSIGWYVERLGTWQAPDRLREPKLIFAGEPHFMMVIANSLAWSLLDAPLDWLVSLPFSYTKRPIQFMTLAQARTLTQPTFIKPAAAKVFAATVYASGASLPTANPELPNSTPVLTSEPVSWTIEFRFFILERRVITYSSYWYDDQSTRQTDGTWQSFPAQIEEALAYLNTFLADPAVQLPPAIVVDIGKILDRGWAIIEANAAWAAGIYGCDPVKVLSVLERACVRRAELSQTDMPWEINRNASR